MVKLAAPACLFCSPLSSAACGLPLPLCLSVLLLLLSLKAPTTTASISLAPALAPCPRLLRTHNLHRHRHTISLLPLPPLGWCSTTVVRLFARACGLLIALVAGWFVLYDYFRVSVCGSRYSCRIEGTCDLVRERWWLCVSRSYPNAPVTHYTTHHTSLVACPVRVRSFVRSFVRSLYACTRTHTARLGLCGYLHLSSHTLSRVVSGNSICIRKPSRARVIVISPSLSHSRVSVCCLAGSFAV